MLSDLKVSCKYFFILLLYSKLNHVYSISGSSIPQRWLFALMGFLAIAIGNALRVILSVTITEMVHPGHETLNFQDESCPFTDQQSPKNRSILNDQSYDWNEYTQVYHSNYYEIIDKIKRYLNENGKKMEISIK